MGLGIPGLWALLRLPASYRGLPFIVLENNLRRGRQVALHQYPFRDDPWPEDLGRSPRITSIRGFVLGDTCDLQIAALTAAVEKAGPGTLVHPSLGTLSVQVLEFVAADNPERGRMWSFEMTVVPYVPRVYPVVAANTQAQTQGLFGAVGSAVATTFSRISSVVAIGLDTVSEVVSTVSFYANAALGFMNSATSLVHVVAALSGNFGRFAGGSVAANVVALGGGITTVDQGVAVLLGTATAAQDSADTLTGLAQQPAANASLLTAQAQAMTEAIRTNCADPLDAINALAAFVELPLPMLTQPSAVAAQALTASVFVQSGCASIALACADYQPASSTEASVIITRVGTLLDDVIVAAADAEQDASYLVLRQLRQAVIADLRARSAALPALITVTLPGNLPSLALAYRLYGDVAREPEMVARANVSAPGFMPASFEALAA